MTLSSLNRLLFATRVTPSDSEFSKSSFICDQSHSEWLVSNETRFSSDSIWACLIVLHWLPWRVTPIYPVTSNESKTPQISFYALASEDKKMLIKNKDCIWNILLNTLQIFFKFYLMFFILKILFKCFFMVFRLSTMFQTQLAIKECSIIYVIKIIYVIHFLRQSINL